MLERRNTVSGKLYRDDPAIMVGRAAWVAEGAVVLGSWRQQALPRTFDRRPLGASGASRCTATSADTHWLRPLCHFQAFNLINEPRCSAYEVRALGKVLPCWLQCWTDQPLCCADRQTTHRCDPDPSPNSFPPPSLPLPQTPECTDVFQKWVLDMATHFKSLDQQHLLTVGSEGQRFAPLPLRRAVMRFAMLRAT